MAQVKLVLSKEEEKRIQTKEEEDSNSKRGEKTNKKTQKMKSKNDFPPISFEDHPDTWNILSRGVLLMKESIAFNEDVMLSHRLYKGTEMRYILQKPTSLKKKFPYEFINVNDRDNIDLRIHEQMVNKLQELEENLDSYRVSEQLPDELQTSNPDSVPKKPLMLEITEAENSSPAKEEPKDQQDDIVMDLPEHPQTPSAKIKARRSASVTEKEFSPVAPHFGSYHNSKFELKPLHTRDQRRRSCIG